MAHSRAVVMTAVAKAQNQLSFPQNPADWILLPVNARRRYQVLLNQQPALETQSAYNSYIAGSDYSLGVIACGIGYNYLMEAFDGLCPYPVLKIAQYPMPKEMIRQLAAQCDSILVIEDGQPFVEEQLRGVLATPVEIRGRLSGELPRVGELTPDNVRAALGLTAHSCFAASANVVPRPPALCAGCGHRDVYEALNQVVAESGDYKIFSDIGCYTLGALPPFRAIHSCVDMGASITMAKGAADAGLKYSVAVIGDSTFTHSGMTGLLDAVNSGACITVIISDNLTTAMTGGQDSAGTSKIEQICLGLGLEADHLKVVVPIAKNLPEIKEIIRSEIEYRGVSVIIPRRECIQTLKKHIKK